MNFAELKNALAKDGSRTVRFRFDAGGEIEAHCHVTEIGRVSKDFVDCGGARRSSESCVLQTFVAGDVDHRLNVETLGKIIAASKPLGLNDTLPVEVEYQTSGNQGTIGVFLVTNVENSGDTLTLILSSKATACLAPDQCGIESSVVELNVVGQPGIEPSTVQPAPGGC